MNWKLNLKQLLKESVLSCLLITSTLGIGNVYWFLNHNDWENPQDAFWLIFIFSIGMTFLIAIPRISRVILYLVEEKE